MKLYRTGNGNYVEHGGSYYQVPESRWDALVAHENLPAYLGTVVKGSKPAADFSSARIEAPIGSQEVWAAGVTYYRSRSARMRIAERIGNSAVPVKIATGKLDFNELRRGYSLN